MADRTLYSQTSDPMPTGLQFLQQYHDRLLLLLNASVLSLTAVGGTGNAVAATIDPALTAGLVEGMKFALTWAAANTGPVTLALNGGTPVPVRDAIGADLTSGKLAAGQRSLIEYVSGSFRIMGGGSTGEIAAPYFTAITASTTWTRPSGYAADAAVLIEAWGGGGSGYKSASGGGGGGGGYAQRQIRYADVPSSLTVSIGAGGASKITTGAGNPGGNTTFGTLLTAYGGAGGAGASVGGVGGGEVQSGADGGAVGGGGSTQSALTIHGGGGGGTASGKAGAAVYGGGGGGGSVSTTIGLGGLSARGGAGGRGYSTTTPGDAGSAPGGGGGSGANSDSGAGGRGEVRVWIGG